MIIIDRETSKKNKEAISKNSNMKKIATMLSISLLIPSVLGTASCKFKNDNDVQIAYSINYEDRLNDSDELRKYFDICRSGYLKINGDDKTNYYYIYDLAFLAKSGIKTEYHLTYHNYNEDIITKEKIKNSLSMDIYTFMQTSIMVDMYFSGSVNINYDKNDKPYIEMSENKFKELIQNWNGNMYHLTNPIYEQSNKKL